MASEHLQPDDSDDAQLSWLLSSAHAVPEMRREFASSLADRLDAGFAARGRVGMNGSAAPSSNGVAPTPVDRVERGQTQHEPKEQELTASLAGDLPRRGQAESASKPVRRSRHWAVVAASAASLLVAVAVFSDPPAWAAALRAIVHRISEFTIGGAPEQAAQSNLAGGQAAAPLAADIPTVAQPASTAESRAIDVTVLENQFARSEPTPPIPTTVPDPPHEAPSEPAWQPFAEPLPTGELSQRVDDELAAVWQANAIQPVGGATDEEFMRRVYLDLTGRIPSVSEVEEFLEDPSADRREALVDRLLEHRDHATHLAAVWRDILLPAEADLSRLGGTAKFEEWLAERFAQNTLYDKLVSELLLAEGRVSESGPLLFYAALKLNPEELAGRTSRAFLGLRMECAQCHDHKLDENITQNDFWSFAAFFARISRPRGKMEMTSPVLAVRDNQQGDVMIPDSDEIVLPRLPLSAVNVTDSPDGPTRREALVDWLTSPNNGQFARATVNRVWAHLFGRGLVEPVDDMRPANKAIAPAVLETLSRDFAASGFDLRRLLRALVLTQAYQLSSRSEESDPSRTLHFAQMNIKSLTAEQLYDCISVATPRGGPAPAPTEQPGLVRFGDVSRQAFIEQFRAPAGQATDYHAGIPQALTLMHGGLIYNATDVASSGLLKSLAAPFFTDDQRLDTLFLATLSRYPTDAEREVMLKLVDDAGSEAERQQTLGDVLWALLNSAEFTFNH